MPALFSKGVIDSEQKQVIHSKVLKKDKVSFLFDQIIIEELDSGISTKYDNLIKEMEDSDDTTANHLARLLQGTYACNFTST